MSKLKRDSIEFVICPNCSSTDCLENYPNQGEKLCTKCGHQSEKITLTVIQEDEEISDCYFCGKQNNECEPFFEDADITIFKCKNCEKLNGYKILDSLDFGYIYDDAYDSLPVKKAKAKKHSIISTSKNKDIKKEFKKRKTDALEKCKNQLDYLICSLEQELSAENINHEITNSAKKKVVSYIELMGPQTNNKLRCLFVAALLTKNIFTERQLEKIFGITRKTLRKWKNILTSKLDL